MQTKAVQPDQRAPDKQKAAIRGLYAVTPECTDTEVLCALVEAALAGGAGAIQYRNKSGSTGLRLAQAARLVELCRRYDVPLIVNDTPEIAATVGASGVHLGAEDGPIEAARAYAGHTKIVGISCYRDLQLAMKAQESGADYVAFGSFFASTVKPGAVRAPVELLQEAKSVLVVPVIAIGGIDEENAPGLVRAGADGIAVISALFSSPDVKGTAQRLSRLFSAKP